MYARRRVVLVTMVIAAALSVAAGGVVYSKAELSDLSAAADPTDGAWAVASASVAEGKTTVVLNVKGLDRSQAGRVLGAHVHVGPCVVGDGAAARGHYNSGAGGISPDTEVWLDFAVTGGGTGHATAIVPFEISPGTAHSIVIHRDPTAAGSGSAGPRLACIPLEF
jgi:hypothetical protein